jgi:hypothetical protein
VSVLKFSEGDRVKHKKYKNRAGIIEGIASLDEKEIGYWILDDNGSRWILQFCWESNWEKVRK